MCASKKRAVRAFVLFSLAFLLAVPRILNSKPRYAEQLIHPPEISEGSHSHFQATIKGDSSGHLDSSTRSEWLGYIDFQRAAYGIYVVDNYAYVANGSSGLRIVDVSDPYNLLEVGNCNVPDCALDVQVKDNFAYVAAQDSGLRIIDVSDPYNPYEVGYCNFHSFQSCTTYGIYVTGIYAYVINRNESLRIVDVSDPHNPYEVGYYDIPGFEQKVYVVNNYAYVTSRYNSELWIIDISDPHNPYSVGHCATSSDPIDVQVIDDYAYVTGRLGEGWIIDISDPYDPQEVGSFDATNCEAIGIYVVDNYAYIANTSYGLRIIDVSDPYNPYEVRHYDTPFAYARGVYVQGNYVYVVGSDSGGLAIFLRYGYPSSKIDTVFPKITMYGQEVTFIGHGFDPVGTITDYLWESDVDGFLSDLDSFSMSGLSLGIHHITFKVKNDFGNWSEADVEAILVDTAFPCDNEILLEDLLVGTDQVVHTGDTLPISVVVTNRGSESQNFTLIVQIRGVEDTVYSDTVWVEGFIPLDTDTFDFDDWPTPGTCGAEYNLVAWKEPADSVPDDDSLKASLRIGLYHYDSGIPDEPHAWSDQGSAFGVKFVEPADFQSVIDSIFMYFWNADWPDPGSNEVAYAIYDDDGAGGLPGSLLYEDTVAITRGAWNAFAPDTQVVVIGSYYVFYRQTEPFPNCPGIGFDGQDDAPESTQWYYTGGTYHSDEDSSYHYPGDMMIRVLECPVVPAGPFYTRGDADASGGKPNVVDGSYVLSHLLPHPVFPCLRSADADANQSVNIVDASYILSHILPDPSFPPPNWPDTCQNVPTDTLPCDSFPPCGWYQTKGVTMSKVEEGRAVATFEVGAPEHVEGDIYVVPVEITSEVPIAAYQFSLRYDPSEFEVIEVRDRGTASEEFDYYDSYVGEGRAMAVGVVSMALGYNGKVAGYLEAGGYRIAEVVVRSRSGRIGFEVEEAILADDYSREVRPEVMLGVGEGGSRLPKAFALFQNIPNPFGGNTVIRYALPKDAEVELTIYNVAGQRVRTLVNGRQRAGYKGVKWDGRDDVGRRVGPGVYFYKLKAGKFETIRKMAILR